MAKTKLEKFKKNMQDNENKMLIIDSIEIKPEQGINTTK
jgi:predicted ATP-dependent serine protease